MLPDMENSVLDGETVEALRQEGSLLAELRDLFASETPKEIEAMLEAAGRGDCASVERAAHKLKGTAATFGATAMVSLCAAIELAAHAGSTPGIDQQIEQLRDQCEKVKIALDAAIQ